MAKADGKKGGMRGKWVKAGREEGGGVDLGDVWGWGWGVGRFYKSCQGEQ